MALSSVKVRWLRYFLILAGTLICACGCNAVEDQASSGGGTGGTGISVGSVSGMGSIHVNGVRYDTRNAEILVEGQSKGVGDQAVLDQLSVGMIVRVEGETVDSQSGTAHKVCFNDDIRGPVESIRKIDSATTELFVLGKPVILQDTTRLKNLDLDLLAVGDWIQVSGLQDADGRSRASFVAASENTAKANLKGAITRLNSTDSEFEINGITIDYHAASLVGVDQLSDGLLVEVTGVLLLPDRLEAEKIEPVDLFGITDSEGIHLEGIISEKLSETQLSLDGVTVILDTQTEYSGGDSSDLASDVRVEIEGKLAGGVLYARKIIFLDYAKLESNVETNDVGHSEIDLAGLTDITTRYNEITKVTGGGRSAADIDSSHHVKILGREIGPGTVLAVHIIVKNKLSGKVVLQGQMETDPGPAITILGQSVGLSSVPNENFESPEGVTVGYTGFLDSTARGDPVTAKGDLTGDRVVWNGIIVQ